MMRSTAKTGPPPPWPNCQTTLRGRTWSAGAGWFDSSRGSPPTPPPFSRLTALHLHREGFVVTTAPGTDVLAAGAFTTAARLARRGTGRQRTTRPASRSRTSRPKTACVCLYSLIHYTLILSLLRVSLPGPRSCLISSSIRAFFFFFSAKFQRVWIEQPRAEAGFEATREDGTRE